MRYAGTYLANAARVIRCLSNKVLPPDPGLVIDSEGEAMGASDVDQDWATKALRREWGGACSITSQSGGYAARGTDGRASTGALPGQFTRELRADPHRRNAS